MKFGKRKFELLLNMWMKWLLVKANLSYCQTCEKKNSRTRFHNSATAKVKNVKMKRNSTFMNPELCKI